MDDTNKLSSANNRQRTTGYGKLFSLTPPRANRYVQNGRAFGEGAGEER
jgi:hypothetical protein